jgi:GTPase SAR1 family protein
MLVHVKVLDMPCISYFPNTAYHEWSDFRSCALRSANGYLLVFDLSSPGTFQYVKVIRDQLYESRNMHHVPVFIVGNKADMCSSILAMIRREGHHHHLPHLHVGRPFRLNLFQSSSSSGSSSATAEQRHHHHAAASEHHHHLHLFHHHHHHDDFTPALKDLAGMIKKHWKSTYIECSARYNWRVYTIFKEMFKQMHSQLLLMESSEAAAAAAEPMVKSKSSESLQQHAAQETADSLKTLTLGSKTGGSLAAPGGAGTISSGAHQTHSTSNQQNSSSSCVLS